LEEWLALSSQCVKVPEVGFWKSAFDGGTYFALAKIGGSRSSSPFTRSIPNALRFAED
jgi:hypothetical protein